MYCRSSVDKIVDKQCWTQSSRYSAQLIIYVLDDEHDGANGGIIMKAKAMKPYLFEQCVQM